MKVILIMAGRPKIFDEQSAVEKALEVFWDQCYHTASTEELLKAMGIGKGSFYLTFKGGKQELYQKSIRLFFEQQYQQMEVMLLQAENPITALKKLFRALARGTAKEQQRGCFLGNALVQLSEKETVVKNEVDRLLHQLQQLFALVVTKGQQQGIVNSGLDPELIAWQLLNLWNGIQVTRRMQRAPEVLQELIETNLEMIL
ncbi:TetR/AcrR family transcriptional regulator [Neptunitalea lumnitzerae]|uniref:TetR family transcriptional regulator n=1 Tax=Neptunitalea lumnitzerae TaxID=2965509 RepID=A0ABQ5MKG4_9FLAO|nr:TetR/AcrR family transcriptional regulator [Neptunitalea sp. Y10]GLB49422.1 TetR family transcriptional regulator [Neptunitalea sp. Y10]